MGAGGRSSGEGRGPGPARGARGGCDTDPPAPQGSREFGRLPFNFKGSMSNDPLGLGEKELKYLVTVLDLTKFVSLKLLSSSHSVCSFAALFDVYVECLSRLHIYLPFNEQNKKKLVASVT